MRPGRREVDDKWHALTYKQKWYINGEGYATSGKVTLHKGRHASHRRNVRVWRDASIDHIDPTAAGQPRSTVATHAEQSATRRQHRRDPHIHVGVSAVGDRWSGEFSYTTSEGQRWFCTPVKTEKEVVLLNAKRLEVHGDKAILNRFRFYN
jgi:hypothetical protein